MLTDQKHCTGCMACYAACTRKAIEIAYDDEGFPIPQINMDKCIRCGACKRVCPEQNPVKLESDNVFWAVSVKQRIPGSATTGLFGLIARWFIQTENCYVCGCILDEHQNAIHIVTRDPAMVARMSGSKYIQSDMRDAICKIRNVLQTGGRVLFGGLPCQGAALLNCCAEYRERLFIIDLFCRGIASPLLWKKYLHETAPDVEYCHFRPQDRHEEINWNLLVKRQGRRAHIRLAELDPYLTLYFSGLINRESCYTCRYQRPDRGGDLSLGDCANYKDLRTELKTTTVGIAVCGTEKGKSLLKAVEKECTVRPIDREKEIKLNTGFHPQGKRPPERDAIGASMMHMPIRKLKRRYIRIRIKPLIRMALRRLTTPKQRARMNSIMERMR